MEQRTRRHRTLTAVLGLLVLALLAAVPAAALSRLVTGVHLCRSRRAAPSGD
ncbi:MAG: hypothetical protein ACE5LU_27865 [Anaerolineae bacterium]